MFVRRRLHRTAVCLAIAASLLAASSKARADWEVFPESRHQLYQSYGFFIEQHNIAVWRGADRYWAAVAANLPLFGRNDLESHPQFIFHLSGNDSMHVDGLGGVYTETLDTRIGLMYEVYFHDPDIGLSVGYFHESGHTVDGTDDPALNPLNLGDNVFRIRGVHDFDKMVRIGLTIDPVVHSIPENLVSGADEFAEYFPIGSREAEHKFSPFIASGLAHRLDFKGTVTFHIQTGITWGNHFDVHHTGDFRIVVGYYNGSDPRAKYAQFLGAHAEFGYFGIMFSL